MKKLLTAIMFAIFLVISSAVATQEEENALACIDDFSVAYIVRPPYSIKMETEDIAEWREVVGVDVWAEDHFDVPDDTTQYLQIFAFGDNGERYQIWLLEAPSTPEWLWVLPFSDVTITFENGVYAMHPCGAFRVDAFSIYLLIDKYIVFY